MSIDTPFLSLLPGVSDDSYFQYDRFHELCVAAPSQAKYLYHLIITSSLTSLSLQCLFVRSRAHLLPTDNSLQCTINGSIFGMTLVIALINHPEMVVEKSLSIVIGYLSRLDLIQQSKTNTLSATTSICSDQPVEFGSSTKLPLFPLIEFECVVRVQDPGVIIVYVDKFQPSSKAAEVSFPSMFMDLLYRADFDKDNWLVMSLGVEFSAVSFSAFFLDFLNAVMIHGLNDQTTMENTRSDVKMEERQTVQTSSFYEEDDYIPPDRNECVY